MKYFISLIGLAVVGLLGGAYFYGTKTIDDLLGEKKKLMEAISNLTTEETIGHAKVVNQYVDSEGVTRTTLLFREYGRDQQTVMLEKQFTVDGDVVFFDGLVVIFPSELVMDGKERAIYLWRRLFGENMEPSEGFSIEATGEEPARYREVFERLGKQDRATFWGAMWELSNDPQQLEEHGVRAIYGNALSVQMKPGLIYTFTLVNTGQVTVETRPDL